MNRLVRMGAAAMAAMIIACGANAGIEAKAIPSVPYDGAMTPVIADKTDGEFATAPTLWYKSGSGSYVDQTMKPTANGRYVGYLPAVGVATTFNFYVTDGVDTSTPTPDSVAVGSSLDYSRFHDGAAYNASTAPYGWKLISNSSSNCIAQTPKYMTTGSSNDLWIANGIGNQSVASPIAVQTAVRALGGSIDESIGMKFPVAAFQNLPPSAMPYIRSPKLEGGVGTIDFRSILVTQNSGGVPSRNIRMSEVTLQVAYTEEEPVETNWVTVAVYKYGKDSAYGNVFSRINHEVLNDPDVTFVRILRTGFNEDDPETTGNGRLAIDNICITKPPADVGIVHKLENPGYPSQGSNVLIRCSVTNVVDATPATNRQVKCFYQYVPKSDDAPDASKWLSTPMAYRGATNGMDWYEGTIGGTNTGYVWYYYQVDYDGYCYGVNPDTTSAAYGSHESLSPAYWTTDASGENSIHSKPTSVGRYQVRPYPSRYSRVAFSATDPSLSQGAMTLVDRDTWQCVVPVTGLTVVSNYFHGYGFYAEDADEYASEVVTWGENTPPTTLTDPTLAGYLESDIGGDAVTNRLVALNEKVYTGFYLYRFASDDDNADVATRYNYIVKKAVYQDFNDWTASPDYYESSLGGLPTITYAEDFDGNPDEAAAGSKVSTSAWSVDEYASGDDKTELNFENDSGSWDSSGVRGVRTLNGFYRTGSRVLTDRLLKDASSTATANTSLAIDLGGQVENLGHASGTNAVSITYGLEKIEFRARASVSDDNFALYKGGTAWTLASANNDNGPYIYISTKWYFEEVSPSKPYFSYILFYQPQYSYLEGETDAQSKWYELRIIKDDSTTDDNTAVFQLRHRDSTGKDDLLGEQKMTGALYKFLSNNPKDINIRLNNNNNRLYVKINVDGNNPNSAHVTLTHNKKTFTDTSIASVGGTIGFGVFDAVPVISKVTVGTSYGDTTLLNTPISEANWSHGGKNPDNNYRWTFPTESSATVITRKIPQQTIGVYVADAEGDEERVLIDNMMSAAVFTTNVSSLAFSNVTIPIHDWARKFVTIRYDDGDGGVVIDDIRLTPWRARTRYEGGSAILADGTTGYRSWKTKAQQNTWLNDTELDEFTHESIRDHWAILEGWVANSGALRIGANFVRSRANPSLVQGVVSPVLTNGLGSISFAYSVTGGQVVYGVERTDAGGTDENWTPVAVYRDVPGPSGTRYVKIAATNTVLVTSHRVRVRIYGEGDVGDLLSKNPECGYDPAWGHTAADAAILIDNLRVKDYPANKNDNAWIAYNLLITEGSSTNMNLVAGRTLVGSGLIYNNSGKSCFFNNSPTAGTYGSDNFNDDDPYLQTPPLYGVGVGEIAFHYRLVPDAEGNVADGEIRIEVSKVYEREWGHRDGEWTTITNITLSASGDEGRVFVKFDNPKIFDEDHYVVRFYNVRNASKSRFVIDNVLVTAPARPSFEFEFVRLSPVQPLAGTNTTVAAKIMRQILNPQNVKVYCSYHVYDRSNDQDVWGYRNWFKTNETGRVQLVSVGGNEYCATNGLPAFDTDDLVEYVVWGVHDEINVNAGDNPIWQGAETFTNPEWYKTFNTTTEKIEPMDENGESDYETGHTWSPYFWVYSCAPGTFFVNEVNNWYSRTGGDRNTAEYVEFAAPAGTDISGWRFQIFKNYPSRQSTTVVPANTVFPNDTRNGWGFYVWGDSWSTDINRDLNFANSADQTTQELGTYGGIIVYRSNDIVEQLIAYGTKGHFDTSIWTETGRKTSGSRDSPSLLSKDDPEDPERLLAGASISDFYWARATQSPGAANGIGQVFADNGYVEAAYLVSWSGSENVVVSNGVEEVSGEYGDFAEGTILTFYPTVGVITNINGEAVADLTSYEYTVTDDAEQELLVLAGVRTRTYRSPSGREITDESVKAWIERNGATQEDIDALGTDDRLDTLYLLNQNLTETCSHSLDITGVSVGDRNMSATATLTRTEAGTNVVNRAINGRLVLEGAETLEGGFMKLDPTAREISILDTTSGNDNEDFSESNDVEIHFLRLRIE